jgi:Rrf2 family protein
MRSSPLLHVTIELDDALRTLLVLAETDDGCTCEHLASHTGISQRYLSTLLQKLRRAGLVRRRARRQAGFELAVPAREIRVSHVVAAIQGVWAGAPRGPGRDDDPLGHLWSDVERELEARLSQLTVADLASTSVG